MTKEIEWDYSLKKGPESWVDLCEEYREACNKYMQSPIALSQKKITNLIDRESLQIEYGWDDFHVQWQKHTFHFNPLSKKNKVLFNGSFFFLHDIHFHVPSEHSIEGMEHPLEFHFVHQSETGDPLVIAVLFHKIASEEEKGQAEKNHPTFNWKIEESCISLNPEIFIPTEKEYYAYYGSYTTPPCSGDVHWIVFSKVATIFSQTLTKLVKEKEWVNNNRPLQNQEQQKIWHTS